MGTLALIALAIGVVGLLLLRRTLNAVGQRLGDRIAAWLLPENQAFTFRLAAGIAVLSHWLAPRTILFAYLDRHVSFYRSPNRWKGPEAAAGELLDGLASGQTVRKPVRFVWPLLRIAIRTRLRNAFVLLTGGLVRLLWLPWYLTSPFLRGVAQGWLAFVALCCLSLAGMTEAAIRGSAILLAVGACLSLVSLLAGNTSDHLATARWVNPSIAAIAFSAGWNLSGTPSLTAPGSTSTLVTLGLVGAMLTYFLLELFRSNVVDAFVDAILTQPEPGNRRRQLWVTRLQLLTDIVTKGVEAVGIFGVSAFAVCAALSIGPPAVWIATGLAIAALASREEISVRAAWIHRPPACIGDPAEVRMASDPLANDFEYVWQRTRVANIDPAGIECRQSRHGLRFEGCAWDRIRLHRFDA